MRLAREEKLGKKRSAIKFGGKRFTLPAELPLDFASSLTKGDPEAAIRAVLNGKADEFLALGPTYGDFADLANAIAEHYTGVPLGNSSASTSS